MQFQFNLKNGKTKEIAIPDGFEVHRALVWTKQGNNKEMTSVIVIPDDVERVELITSNLSV